VSDSDLGPEAEARYVDALEERGLEDLRPLYRDLLRRMRDEAPTSYDEAVRRYREEVAPAAASEARPLRVWLRYGAWMARQIAPGRLVSVDRTGRATDLDAQPEEVPAGALVLHLPEERSVRALPLAVPASPSAAQQETQDLLC
jgi:hypothetical protein